MKLEEEQIRGLLDEAPVMVWLTDTAGSCVFINRRWQDFTGQTAPESYGTGWLEMVHPDDRAAALEAFRNSNAQQAPVRLEYRLRSRDGQYRWMIDSAAPRFGPDGEFAGFIGSVLDIHDHRETEVKLRATEDRYRTLFESIDEGFCVVEMVFDPEGRPVDYRWLEVNPTFEEQTGLLDPVGKTARELVPDLDEFWFRTYGEVALSGEPVRFENHAPALNRWFDVFAFRVDRPELRRVAILFNDVSERKIRELNAAFLSEIGGAFARVTDVKEIMSLVGDKLCRYLGTRSAAFGEIDETESFGTVVHQSMEAGVPDLSGIHRLSDFMSEGFLKDLRAGRTIAIADVRSDPRTAEMAEAYVQFGVRAQIQSPYLRDGRWKFMMAVYSPKPRTWHAGEIDLMRDLSARVWLRLERARAEADLRESERQARAFFEGSGVGAAQVGTDRRFRKVNDRFCQIVGYSREELLRMTPMDLDHPAEREVDASLLQRLFDEPGFTYDVEKRYVRKDSQEIWVHVNARAIPGDHGSPLYTAAIVEDITDRRRAEDALRELSRSLEHRVAERTAELQELAGRLRQMAAELATAEQRERKRLAALLHDDLQQLLVAANMHLNNAGRRMRDSADREAVEQAARWISEATTAARALTHQLRPPALYEDGLVAALHGLAGEMAERHHLEVTIEGREGPTPVHDDVKALLFESIRELLFNAAKHADIGAAVVRVGEVRDLLQVVVEDHGKGFDLKAAARNRQSTGFGLFSIRERLAALGGRITIASSPGQGTRIVLNVPLSPEIVDEGSLEELNGTDAVRPPAELLPEVEPDSRIRVLVVDDHAMVRQGLATLLDEDQRLVVVGEAADGVAAVAAVEQHRPDVILVDVNMPRMNGIEATREIRRRWPAAIVIGLSVQDDETTARAMREAGAASFLSKGRDSNRMIATIVALAGRDGQGRA